jgi:hypothetical protein
LNISKLLPSTTVIALFFIIVSSCIGTNPSLYAIEKLNATKATGAYKAGSPGVKILYPVQGGNISVGKNLTLTGISSYKEPTGCLVSVIVNNIKPYKQAQATGQKGKNDYSTWKYTINANQGLIKEGVNTNKATAKLSCHDNAANITKYYSVNLTGTSGDHTNESSRLHQNASNNINNRTLSLSTITTDQAAHPEKALLPASSELATSQHRQPTNTQKLMDNSSILSTAPKSTSVGSSKSKVSAIESEKPLADKNNEPFVLTLPSSNSSSPLPTSASSTQRAVQDSPNQNLRSHNQRGN